MLLGRHERACPDRVGLFFIQAIARAAEIERTISAFAGKKDNGIIVVPHVVNGCQNPRKDGGMVGADAAAGRA
jgi:hypothetical protein